MDYFDNLKEFHLIKASIIQLHRLITPHLQGRCVLPMPLPYLRVGQVAWTPQKKQTLPLKTKTSQPNVPEPVLISAPDRKDMICAFILHKELANSWGRAFPRGQSAHPPRTTGEGRPPVPNLGLLPSVLEGNQVTNILLTEIWFPLTGKVGFFQA